MKEKRDCKIVQDLLPNYIEKLTVEETNRYIDEHIKECEECKKILKNMQKDLKNNNIYNEKKEVNYIKKYSNKMRILKIIILLIIIIFIIAVGRKIFIISKLSDNAENFITSTNYHRIIYSYNMGEYTKSEIFSLDDKKKIIMTKVTDEGRTIRKMFSKKINDEVNGIDKYITNTYIDSDKEKIAILNQESQISVDPQNALYTENWWELLIYSIPANIKKATFNGKECYYISNFQSEYSFAEGMYINKETGLPISTIAYEYENLDGTKGRYPSAEYIYEFNTVTDADFIEPNVNEYLIKK